MFYRGALTLTTLSAVTLGQCGAGQWQRPSPRQPPAPWPAAARQSLLYYTFPLSQQHLTSIKIFPRLVCLFSERNF